YQVTLHAQTAGVAALKDQKWAQDCKTKNEACRDQLCNALADLRIQFEPSHTNFVLVHVGGETKDFVARAMKPHGFMFRDPTTDRLAGSVRISLGTSEQMENVIAFLQEEVRTGLITPAGSEEIAKKYRVSADSSSQAKPAAEKSRLERFTSPF